ncbi:MAG TPA: hypothetical protein VMQ83_10755 [Gammaproteobacteria bacterium]|nr:hypothetical protein [Gammaproteobacteria bacterium]
MSRFPEKGHELYQRIAAAIGEQNVLTDPERAELGIGGPSERRCGA